MRTKFNPNPKHRSRFFWSSVYLYMYCLTLALAGQLLKVASLASSNFSSFAPPDDIFFFIPSATTSDWLSGRPNEKRRFPRDRWYKILTNIRSIKMTRICSKLVDGVQISPNSTAIKRIDELSCQGTGSSEILQPRPHSCTRFIYYISGSVVDPDPESDPDPIGSGSNRIRNCLPDPESDPE